jgi:hypothetical protein
MGPLIENQLLCLICRQINYVSLLQAIGHLSENRPWDLLLYNVMLTLEEHRYFRFAFKVDWILKFPCNQRLFINCSTRVEGKQNV